MDKLAVHAHRAVRSINGVVVSSGLMQKTVKVAIAKQDYHKHLRKHFNLTKHVLVHDPKSSLRTGDIVSIQPGWRVSKHVHHVVEKIIAPFGTPIEERPRVLSRDELIEEKARKLAEKRDKKDAGEGLEGVETLA